MAKVMFSIAVLALAGCASTGEWRGLTIDGSSESAFGETLTILNDELSLGRQQKFALALVDIVQTEVQKAEQDKVGGDEAYTDEDYRRQLDGLTYDGVIALADQTGTSIAKLYSYAGSARTLAVANRQFSPPPRMPAGEDRLSGVNPGNISSDAWKEPGFSPSNFRYP